MLISMVGPSIWQRVRNVFTGELQVRRSDAVDDVIHWIIENKNAYLKTVETVADAISKNPYFRRAADIIESQIYQLPLLIFDKKDEVVEKGYLVEVLLKQPNPSQTLPQFLEETIGWLLSAGHWGWIFKRGYKNQIASIVNLKANKLRPLPGDDPFFPIKEFNYQSKRVPREEVIYNSWWTPGSQIHGESPFHAAIEEAATAITISRLIKNLAKNGQRPGGFISPKSGSWSDEDLAKLKKAFTSDRPINTAGEWKVITGEADIRPAVITPHEAQLLETAQAIKQSINVATGMPTILMEAGQATYENQKEAMKNLWRLTLIPIIRKIEQSFTQGIVTSYDPTWKARLDLSGVMALKADYKEIAQATPALLEGLSIDEWRARLPDPAPPLVFGGDIIRGDMNEPIGQAPPVEGAKPTKGIFDEEEKKPKKKPKDKELEEEPEEEEKSVWDRMREGLQGKESIKYSKLEDTKRKAAGGLSGEIREAAFQTRKAQLDNYRRKFAIKLASLYRRQHRKIKDFLAEYDDDLSGLPDMDSWLNWSEEENRFFEMAFYSKKGVFGHAGSQIFKDFKIRPEHRKKLEEDSHIFAERVTDTTKRHLEEAFEVIQEPVEEGFNLEDLLKKITEAEIIQYQDELEDEEGEEKQTKKGKLLALVGGIYFIAEGMRTKAGAWKETHDPQGYGLTEGIRQKGGNLRQWLSSFLTTSRQEHMDADGQVVGLDETFVVGDEALMWPGDSAGSPGNTINCNCFIGIAVTEGED
jgi:HK97 family phage portal protein